MKHPTLAELIDQAAASESPRFATSRSAQTGGVDPLGLRQINFDLMDQVLPGINNVGRHLRPFVVTTWAWRRAAILGINAGNRSLPTDLLRDFVDRIEVIYAWSHFLMGKADLPGADVLTPLVHQSAYRFGGAEWTARRDVRSRSTGFMAAINYGPALRTLGLIEPDPMRSGAMRAVQSPIVQAALDAFEGCIKRHLTHPAFSTLGEVEFQSSDARDIYEDWAMHKSTDEERIAMRVALASASSSPMRSDGIALMLAAMGDGARDLVSLRRRMCEPHDVAAAPTLALERPRLAWRRMQVRQAFRLALESLLHWVVLVLKKKGPHSTIALAGAFHDKVPRRAGELTARSWFTSTIFKNPVDAIEAVRVSLSVADVDKLPDVISDTLAFCLAEAPTRAEAFETSDRLPLARARREALAWQSAPATAFLRHIFESWILAQHVYWSAGRGLADARANGKTLLRLRVVMEEAGWTLAPGTKTSAAPNPTADRLETAVNLARECGLLFDHFESWSSSKPDEAADRLG